MNPHTFDDMNSNDMRSTAAPSDIRGGGGGRSEAGGPQGLVSGPGPGEHRGGEAGSYRLTYRLYRL